MEKILVNERDQKFVLYEMLAAEKIINTHDFSREQFDMTLKAAHDLAINEVYPALQEGDQQGCDYEGGNVYVPRIFHRLKKLFDDGGWSSLSLPQEYGGQGFSTVMCLATTECFAHNISLLAYTNRPLGSADMINSYGSADQKKRYLGGLLSGTWGGPIAVTEPAAGSDIGAITMPAKRQADGSYRIVGTKSMITNGESDLFENMIYTVAARVEGAPEGLNGLSLFLVPKYTVHKEGLSSVRNDYTIAGIEAKMGCHGWATCSEVHFGEDGQCYGELLGEENMGLPMFFNRMSKAQLNLGLAGTGLASAAYLHALKYSKERVQGAHLLDAANPSAPKVPIIRHPDIRRMLLWMKGHVEGMRAFVYYCGTLADRLDTIKDPDKQSILQGFFDLLTPICRVYCADTAFKVTEQAMQVFGGNGYFKDFPMEQFMRDVKPISLYEGPNGIQAFQLIAMKMGPQNKYVIHLISEMKTCVSQYQDISEIADLAKELTTRIHLLNDIGTFFNNCAAEGKLTIPIANAYPMLNMMGITIMGWLLFWQAGIASAKLSDLLKTNAVDPDDMAAIKAFSAKNKDAAFYDGKLKAARYYIKHCLPQADALASAIRTGDLSMMDIPETAF